MRSLLYSLLVSSALLSAGAAYAAEEKAGGALKPLTPPQADFKKICKPLWQPKVDITRNWSDWDGKTTNLTVPELMDYGNLYRKGNAQVPPSAELAIKFLTLVANSDSKSQGRAKHYLADYYLFGNGVTQDREKALQLFKEAWQADVIESGFNLAILSTEDNNYPEAAAYYLQGVNKGSARSALALAHMYNSEMVPTPSADAAKTMMILAENLMLSRIAKGECNALYEVGAMYATGLIVPQDKEIAKQWFEAAAQAGVVVAMNELADIYLTIEGGAEAAKKAVQMWQHAAELGSSDAMFRLGFSYYKGEGVAQDIDKGVEWMEKASIFGNSGATEFLVTHYLGEDEDNPNYAAAFEWLKRASALPKANPDLLVLLGEAYRLGEGTSRNEGKAFALYERAAAQGSREGFFKVGEAYLYGRGVKQEPVKSLRFFRVAALRGHQEATRQLMLMYRCGMGVHASETTALNWRERAISAVSTTAMLDAAQDYYTLNTNDGDKKGFNLILEAAEEEDRRAMALISLAYEYGHGTDKDSDQAAFWQKKALAPGAKQSDAPYTLAQSYLKGYLAPKDIKKAQEYLQQAVNAENVSASYELGRRYLTGKDGFPKKEEEGRKLLKQAAARGNMAAMNILAKYYMEHPDPTNPNRGQEWLKKAAHAGHILSMAKLAEAYQLGRGVPVDMEAAEQWIKHAEDSFPCDVSELVALGRSYARGIGVSANGKKASQYLSRAAEAGDVNAMREVGMMYLDGLAGIERDSTAGVSWLRKAAQNGDERSMLALGNAYAAGDGVERSAQEAMTWWKKAADAGNKDAAMRLEAAKDTSAQ